MLSKEEICKNIRVFQQALSNELRYVPRRGFIEVIDENGKSRISDIEGAAEIGLQFLGYGALMLSSEIEWDTEDDDFLIAMNPFEEVSETKQLIVAKEKSAEAWRARLNIIKIKKETIGTRKNEMMRMPSISDTLVQFYESLWETLRFYIFSLCICYAR
ncbi:MAG: hypothetical protein HYW78_03790 [Parcubacteria group bacterium]|nr:hypothetical protein [Parcubacteria group bacterium]